MRKSKRRRRRPGNLAGISKGLGYRMAEFFIGRGVGVPVGTVFQDGPRKCKVGKYVAGRTRDGIVPFSIARATFLGIRASQVGEDAGATLTPSWGIWRGGREPSVLGRVLWWPDGPAEKDEKLFYKNMTHMCQALACGLAQREVVLRYSRPGASWLHRCSPTGAPWPLPEAR